MMNHKQYIIGDPDAGILLLQMVDDHDMEVIGQEAAYIRELTGEKDFCLAAVKVNSWNHDLSPWPAPAVFGNEDFGDGAETLLEEVLTEVIPSLCGAASIPGSGADDISGSSADDISGTGADRKIYIGGYSLAGLFALWAGYQTDRFRGVAAASPSVWFPGFIEFMKDNRFRADAAYLSLGDREEKTRNPVMAQVGRAIREAQSILDEAGTDCVLGWNPGNHFREPDLRTAKAFAWLINRESGRE